MRNILLIGAGQLGSRHLQGLSGSRNELNIVVVDLSLESLHLSRQRWNQCDRGWRHQCQFVTEIPRGISEFDIAIVSTGSRGRVDLVRKLRRDLKIEYWVIEKIPCQSVAELNALVEMLTFASGAWVNFPRRLMALHKQLKDKLGGGPISMNYSSGYPELAGNILHFIDLVSWYCGTELEQIDTSGMGDHWFPAKRPGYFEVDGLMRVSFLDGSKLTYSESATEPSGQEMFYIEDSEGRSWSVSETDGFAASSDEMLPGELELQSTLTGKVVDQMLEHGDCDLTPLVDCQHNVGMFLAAMGALWDSYRPEKKGLVPIT